MPHVNAVFPVYQSLSDALASAEPVEAAEPMAPVETPVAAAIVETEKEQTEEATNHE